ncbi:hypothetical protein [Streptomyces sp. NPDC002156]
MEMIQIILQAIYSLLTQLTIVWPVGLLLLGAFFLVESSKKYRKFAAPTFLIAGGLVLVLLLILTAGQAYGVKAMAYQQFGVLVYYITLGAWFIYAFRGRNKKS